MEKDSILSGAADNESEFPIGVFSQTAYLPRNHHHIEYEIFYLDDGRADFCIEGSHRNVFPGDIIFLEPGTDHYVKSILEGEEFHYHAIVFDVSALGKSNDLCRSMFESIKVRRFLSLSPALCNKIRLYISYKKDDVFGSDFMIKSLLFEIITYIIQTKQYEVISPLHSGQKHNVSAIDSAIVFIREHFKENITLDDILNITNYSKSHFSRLFKDSVGMNVTEYINKFRIEKSCLELIYTNKNITEIATENGFNNIQYFSRVFRQFMDCTPKQYQKKAKDVIIPSSIPDSIRR
ncbi:MAG: helix-turn-helix domain-containing protein [Treponema sp.]|nr:helix-turn-helix domain-containing protein [Treponema sp.]